MLEPIERERMLNYQRIGYDYQDATRRIEQLYGMPGSGYWKADEAGLYIDREKLQEDIDRISSDEECCPECKKNNEAGYTQGAGVTDPYTAATVKIVEGTAAITQSFKADAKVAYLRNQMKLFKEQCPKKPLIRIGKKAKQRYADHQACIGAAVKAQRDFELALAGGGISQERQAAPGTDEEAGMSKTTKNALIVSAIVFVIIVLIVVIILVIRARRKAAKKK